MIQVPGGRVPAAGSKDASGERCSCCETTVIQEVILHLLARHLGFVWVPEHKAFGFLNARL